MQENSKNVKNLCCQQSTVGGLYQNKADKHIIEQLLRENSHYVSPIENKLECR